MTATTAAKFRFINVDGDWAITGPLAEMQAAVESGEVVTITKRRGTSQVRLTGEVFENDEDGVEGIVWEFDDEAPAKPARTRKPASVRRNSEVTRLHCITGGHCGSFGNGRSCGADDCDGN